MANLLSDEYLKKTVEKDGTILQYGMTHEKGQPDWKLHMNAYTYWTTRDINGNFVRYIELGERCYYHFKKAFDFMWPGFKYHKGFVMEMEAWCCYDRRGVTVIGGTRLSKTFGLAHIVLLDYLCDPVPRKVVTTENGKKVARMAGGTITTIASTELDRLRATLGKDVSVAFQTCAISDYLSQYFKVSNTKAGYYVRMVDNPNASDSERATQREYAINGLGVANTSKEKIQGRHCDRRRMIYDEATGAPDEYFEAEDDNVSNAPDYKGFHLANPTDRYSKFGLKCEPTGDWTEYDLEKDSYVAKSKRLIVHLDAYKSHNYNLYNDWRDGKITEAEYKRQKFDWMIDKETIDEKYEEGSASWYTYVRGGFPPDGLVNKVFPSATIESMKKDKIFDFEPKRFAVCDPAYEYDQCVIHIGEYGKDREGKTQAQFLKSIEVNTDALNAKMSKDKQIALRIVTVLEEWKVHPLDYIQDKTGNGRSVFSHVQDEWDHPESMSIHGCDFGGKATKRTINEGEEKKCNDLYFLFVDELWFRMSEYGRMEMIGGLNNLHQMTQKDLHSREYFDKGGRQTMYSKKELKKTLGRSPDHGDAFVLFGELMMTKGIVPSRKSIKENAIDTGLQFRREQRQMEMIIQDAGYYSETSDW